MNSSCKFMVNIKSQIVWEHVVFLHGNPTEMTIIKSTEHVLYLNGFADLTSDFMTNEPVS